MAHELLKKFCFEFKIMQPEYFMDVMQAYEPDIYMEYLDYTDRTQWESSRILAYLTAQVNSRKKLKIKDIIKLPWDNDAKKIAKKVTEDKMDEMKTEADNIAKLLNSGTSQQS